MASALADLKGQVDRAEDQIEAAKGIAAAARQTTSDLADGKVSLMEGLVGLAVTAGGIWVARNKTRPRAVQREIEHAFEPGDRRA